LEKERERMKKCLAKKKNLNYLKKEKKNQITELKFFLSIPTFLTGKRKLIFELI